MYYVGIDLGGTTIKGGIVDEKGKIIISKAIPTEAQRNGEEIIKSIALLSKELIENAKIPISNINSIGIGSPGLIDSKNKKIILASNINFKNINIEKEMKKHINLDIYIENDANCATVAEFYFGSMKEYNSGIMITVGTGVGGGVIINGKLLKGEFMGETELGHIIVDYSKERCSCGQKGCLECFASANAIIKHAKMLISKNNNTKILEFSKNIENIDAKAIFDAYDLQDKLAIEVIERFNKYMAIGIVNYVNIFRPAVICIGGGVSARKEKLTKPIEKIAEKLIFGNRLETKIIPAILGNDAGIIGAAMLSKVY